MKRLFESFLVFALVVCPMPALAIDTINVVIYGDSLTSGYKLPEEESYAAQLSKKLRDLGYVNVKVVNMSRPGETTAGGLQRISSVILEDPHVVVLELGANDVIRGLKASIINNNLGHIIRRLKEKDAYVVLVGVKAPPNLGNSYVQEIEGMYYSLATTYQLAFYPSALDGIYGKPELSLADGYHPNGKGIGVMVENTYRLVDTGVRWKYEVMLYQDQYRNSQQ